MQSHIHEYVRNKNKQPIGVVVAALAPNGEVRLGWSLCRVKAGDRFDRSKGIFIATSRAVNYSESEIPRTVKSAISILAGRAKKYFKDRSVAVLPGISV